MRKRYFALILSAMFMITPLRVPINLSHAEGLSKAECVMELNTRRVLYESHGDVRLPMASTTKIITAITVLSLCDDLNKKIVIPSEAEGVEGSSVYLKSGEEYSLKDLLYGLMLRSGNDCAVALALHCSGNLSDFAVKMNQTAERAGALNSHFKNPHGLPCRGHYTTARDLTSIACYAMHNPIFQEIVSTKYYEPCHWKNKNKMLYNFEGAIGIKTGYTKEAGRCLVCAATRGGMTLISTVLSCAPMYERSATLLNDAFQSYTYPSILTKEEIFAIGSKKGYVKEEYAYPLLKEEENFLEYKTKELKTPKKEENGEEIIGELEIYLAKRLLFSTNLYKL